MANRVKAEYITVYADSQLVTRQISGEYEVRDPSLKKYHELVETIWVCFKNARIIQIPRENNCRADELSRLDPSDSTKTIGIFVEYLSQPSIAMEPAILTIDPTDWRNPIISYLQNSNDSTNPTLAKTRMKTACYTLLEGILYKKSFTLPYLRCLGPAEAEYAL